MSSWVTSVLRKLFVEIRKFSILVPRAIKRVHFLMSLEMCLYNFLGRKRHFQILLVKKGARQAFCKFSTILYNVVLIFEDFFQKKLTKKMFQTCVNTIVLGFFFVFFCQIQKSQPFLENQSSSKKIYTYILLWLEIKYYLFF